MDVDKRKLPEHAASLVASLKACTKKKDLQRGAQIHSYLLQRGLLGKDIYLGNALIDLYAKCGRLAKAREVFDRLPFRNVVSWTSLISGYTRHGHCEEALELFFRMMQHSCRSCCCDDDDLSPDSFAFACALAACAKLPHLESGERIHEMIVAREDLLLAEDAFLGNSLIDMYAKCGAMAKAREVFDEVRIRDVVAWTMLIGGYSRCGHVAKALDCYEEMELEGFSPNEATYACILKACASIGALDEGRKVHDRVVREGFVERSSVIGVALVDLYARCGELARARQIFDQLQARDMVTWNALIGGYARRGHDGEALRTFCRMQCESCTPDSITFLAVFKASSGLRMACKARKKHSIGCR